jgi:hypothetical protein
MRLIKSIASYKKADGTWEPQKDIEMHPLEEQEIRAHWAYGEHAVKKPHPLSAEEEMNLVIESGIDAVKAKRKEHEDTHAEWKKTADELEAKRIECEDKFREHCEHCVANGLDPNTHDKEKYAIITG